MIVICNIYIYAICIGACGNNLVDRVVDLSSFGQGEYNRICVFMMR